jgi:hypothetical protein
MPPVLCSFDAIEAFPIRPRRGPRARRSRAQPAALRRSHRLRVAHAPSLARTMSAATSHHATALAGARNLASSRSVRGAAIRATARVARSAPRGASLRVNAEGTTPPPYCAPPRPAPATSGASPPRLPASPRANARPAACVTETARVTWQTRRHVATGRIPTPLAADAARPRAIERRRGPRAGTRARSPTRRLASARDHRGGPSRASAPRDDDVVAPYPQLDREPGGFVTCRVSDALSRFRRRRKRREDLDETVGVESSSNALAPTGRRVRRGRAIIRAPIILTDPPPLLPARWFRRFPPLPLLLRAQPPRRTSR